jgi:DNA repair exonuclease SbcCD ATPase subunit
LSTTDVVKPTILHECGTGNVPLLGMEIEAAANASVEDLIADRLDSSGLPDSVSNLVLAALLGEHELTAAIDGTAEAAAAQTASAAKPDLVAPELYLQAIVVEGFRGISTQAALRLQPGPGLTVVAGRNGSGKSSFAEAAELAMTGDNKRWSGDRSAVWREGWRNLHASGETRICAELATQGQSGVIKVVREWPDGSRLDNATAYVQAHGQPRRQITEAEWWPRLELFRPFLSYAELGALLNGRPSEMYDAIQAILGLDQLVDAEKRLDAQRKRLDEASKIARQTLFSLRTRLAESSDERARRAEKAVAGRNWDLDAVESLAVGGDDSKESPSGLLSQITAIELPSADQVATAVEGIQQAAQRVANLADTPAEDARRLARLLTIALEHQASHPGETCPVCGGFALDTAWAEATRAEITRLQRQAHDAEETHTELDAAIRTVRGLAGPVPRVLSEEMGTELDPANARKTWQSWAELAASGTIDQLIVTGAEQFAALAESVTELQSGAAAVLARRSEAWQPVAATLAAWAEQARASQRADAKLSAVNGARTWLRQAGQEIRDARMASFTAKSAEVWGMLRQESNVDLGPVRIVGTANQRKLSLDVTVDGHPSTALSVMSQGELHALGLALFLPRATAPESPFRFIVIDDPVQAMDPAKVDGLARLLSKVATDRQVVVFTHDDRLPEAIRRLQLPATIWEVVRREQSIVELTKNEDPVTRYLNDARAMALTKELSEDAKAPVVAEFCRSALEAACQEAVRARRIKPGVRHADVEQALIKANTLRMLMALALLNDAERGQEVDGELRKRFGQAGVNALHAANAGTHGAYRGNLKALVNDIERLAADVRA